MKSAIFIEENAPRDGIQNETVPFSVEERVDLINSLAECGFRRIQVGSFVNPQRVPQMAGTEEVLERLPVRRDVIYSALVLNERGLDLAVKCGLGHISFFVSASEAHSRENSRCSVREAVVAAKPLILKAKEAGLTVQAGIMNAFGCLLEGFIPEGRVLDMVQLFLACGAEEINLADTAGVANPQQVDRLVRRVREAWDRPNTADRPLALHFHDTYGFGLANVYAAWLAGVRRFDSSCGGLGGCPFIPGVAGNVASEDVVHLFESMGAATGISLERLAAVVKNLEVKLGRSLPGRAARGGAQCDIQPKEGSAHEKK